jgi:hypothetical protein
MKWLGNYIVDSTAYFRDDVYIDNSLRMFKDVTDGNPVFTIGSSGSDRLMVQAVYTSGTQALSYMNLKTYTTDSAAHAGQLVLSVDESNIMSINDVGIRLWAGKGLYIDANTIISDDGSGTTTLSNIDVIDATTEATIEAAIDTLGTVGFTGEISGVGLTLDGNKTHTATGDGAMIHVDTSTIEDRATSGSGTAAKYTHVNIESPLLAAGELNVTTTDAATLYIQNAPHAGTNQTITNPWALWVDDGNARFDGNIDLEGDIDVNGTLEADAITLAGTALGSIYSPIAGSSSITTVGGIGAGEWNAETISVAYGGTGAVSLTDGGILLGSGTGAITAMAVLGDGAMIVGDGTTDPVAESGATLRASIGCNPVAGSSSITTVGTIGNGTWNADVIASNKQKHLMHYRFMGYSTGDGSNYEMAAAFTDAQSPWEHSDTSSSDGLTIPASSGTNTSDLIRSGGHVIPNASDLKKWVGSATYNGADDAYIGLFRWRPVDGSSTDISGAAGTLVLLDLATITGTTSSGNDVIQTFSETPSTSVAAGDIIFTQIKTENSSKHVYFNSTLEVEF